MAEGGEELPGDFGRIDPEDPDDIILIPMASTSHYDPHGHLDETGGDELTSLIPREKNTPLSRREKLAEREESVADAWTRIKDKLPKIDPQKSPFTAEMDEFDHVQVKLKLLSGKKRLLLARDGELNEYLPKTIIKALGPPADEVISEKEEKNTTD